MLVGVRGDDAVVEWDGSRCWMAAFINTKKKKKMRILVIDM